MPWILNDLSLSKNEKCFEDFFHEFEDFLNCVASTTTLKTDFLCSREIGNALVIENTSFMQAVMQQAPRNLKSRIISWVNKHGPYWDDNRAYNDDDYFEYKNIDVTNQGLGECSRRSALNINTSTYSFDGSFNFTPLFIDHGLKEDRLGNFEIKNLWSLANLKQEALSTLPAPKNWKESYDRLVSNHQKLNFSEDILQQLSPTPFTITIHDRLNELCRVLEEYLASRDADGRHTENTEKILQDHFHGSKAWFSDESATDKHKFKNELTFKNPRSGKPGIFTYHGKVKTPQVRIYFEWPVKPNQNNIHVVYIGSKITKK